MIVFPTTIFGIELGFSVWAVVVWILGVLRKFSGFLFNGKVFKRFLHEIFFSLVTDPMFFHMILLPLLFLDPAGFRVEMVFIHLIN